MHVCLASFSDTYARVRNGEVRKHGLSPCLRQTRRNQASSFSSQNHKKSSRLCLFASMTLDKETRASDFKIPSKYRRVVAKHTGNSFAEVAEIEESETPSPKDDEVLVRVDFVGINGGCETFRARGEHLFKDNQGKTKFPLGAEGVGIVVKLGQNATKLKVGQAVAVTGATYSEYNVIKESKCFPIKEASAESVAVSLSGFTAAGALLYKGDLEPGKIVFVSAAAGGTGHFGVGIAKLKNCKVIATCGSKEKAERLKKLGADRVINYKEEDVAQVLAKEFPQQIDVAYEGVGGKLRDAVLANLSPKGRVLAVGYISDYPHNDSRSTNNSNTEPSQKTETNIENEDLYKHSWDLPPPEELFWQSKTIHNGEQTFYGQVWPEKMEDVIAAKRWLFQEFDAGRIQAWTHVFKGIESITEATEFMLSGKSIGKVVVDLRKS